MGKIGHLHHVGFFFFALHFSTCNVRFEPFSEIDGAHDGVDNRDDDQYDGYDSKGRKRFADWEVWLCSSGMLIHADKLE